MQEKFEESQRAIAHFLLDKCADAAYTVHNIHRKAEETAMKRYAYFAYAYLYYYFSNTGCLCCAK